MGPPARVALVHDFLLDLRGAERVFAALCDMYPDADLFTAVYDERGTEGRFAHRTINTSFLERHNGTDRHRNARKARKTYRFSKDWRHHEAVTYLTMYVYNFCWPVRTLRVKDGGGRWQQRSPAMAAGLADHVWSIPEWLAFPSVRR